MVLHLKTLDGRIRALDVGSVVRHGFREQPLDACNVALAQGLRHFLQRSRLRDTQLTDSVASSAEPRKRGDGCHAGRNGARSLWGWGYAAATLQMRRGGSASSTAIQEEIASAPASENRRPTGIKTDSGQPARWRDLLPLLAFAGV